MMNFHRIGSIISICLILVLSSGCSSIPDIPPTPSAAKSTSITPWYKIYGEETENSGSDFLILSDDGFVIVGGMGSFGQPDAIGGAMLLRIDPAGNMLFQEVYGGKGFDAGWDIARALDGGFVIVGETTSFGDGESDGYVIKISESGDMMWEKNFGGSMKEVFGTIIPVQDEGYFIIGNIVDPDDIITDPGVAGYGGFAGRANLYLVKIDQEGKGEWAQHIKSDLNTLATDGLVAQDGSLIVLSSVIKFPQPDDDIVLTKFNLLGEIVWTRTWEEGALGGYALAEDQDGNFIITGHSTSSGKTNPDVFLLKVDQDGNELWFKEFGSDTLIEIGRDVVVMEDGGYAALTYKSPSFYTSESSLSILLVDTEGNLLLESKIELPYPSKGVSFLRHPEGGFVIAGSVIDNNGNFRTMLIRTDLQGNID
jgi:hypothetical protein